MRLTALILALTIATAQAGAAIVVDGDTLIMDGVSIRLDGIDAPEIRQVCRDGKGRAYRCGLAAARKLEALVIGQEVTCTTTSHDRYGRTVAVCTSRRGEINAAMVRSGWALDYARYSHGHYAAEETAARDAHRGLWRGKFDNPARWRHRRKP